MGTIDRVLRLIIGAIALHVSYTYLNGWQMVVGYIVAAVMMLTAISGYCYLYTLFRINTKK